jgi:hypothetical protein
MTTLYKITSFDGEIVRDEGGQPLIFDDYDKAEKAAGMGTVVPVNERALVEEPPVELEEGDLEELNSFQRTYVEILATATNHVAKNKPKLRGKNKRDGHIFHAALREVQTRDRNLRGVALQVVEQVATRNLHRAIGYPTVREYLEAAGWDAKPGGYAYHLCRLGDQILPAIVGMGHDTAELVEPGTGTKLLAASSALNRAIGDRDPDRVDSILDDVRSMNGRDAVRAKYQAKNPENIVGHGGGYQADEDTYVLAVVFESKRDLTWAKQRLGKRVEWDTTGSAGKAKRGLRVFLQP